jgi:two-component system, chemotaxis family, CheB/CheR fusion protein
MAARRHRPNDQLIVVGASAGGVEALSTLVATVPADLDVPIVIAQHLDPARPSHLADILGRRSTLPVHVVEDRTRLAKGVFVVPAHHHVEIRDEEIRLIDSSSGRPQPSIDRLMQSAADKFHEGLLAVILTGIGSDGSIGARAVKSGGGTVIIQNPDTAKFPSMPRSLAPRSVDIVADLENIGPMLKELSTHPATTKQDSEKNAVAAILETLRQQHGIDFSTYKATTIIRRLHRRMVATGHDTMADYRRHIAEDPEESVRLISSFLIKVTEFFRDKDLFEHLRHNVIPSLINEARNRGNEIRIWSAGCATGEEPYSIAILLSEALASEIDDFSIRIFATDLDPDAVAFARRGVYPAPSLANVSPEIIDRYFTKTDIEYEIPKKRSAASPFLASTTWVTGRRFRVWT